jgi:putative peptide zinc metalloprotease protein
MKSLPEQSEAMPFRASSVLVRKDLQFATIRRGLQTVHVVKDPVNLNYFELDEHEFALLQQIDGRKSWEDLRLWFNHRFPPLRLSPAALAAMIWRMYQQGLLVTLSAGQGRKLAERTLKQRWKSWANRLRQPWVIRLPGINPGPWLGVADRLFGWMFSPLFVGVAMLWMIVVVGFLCAQHRAMLPRQSDTSELFSPGNLLLLTLAIIVTKVFHELGHAIAAYRHGCECSQMGIILLAGLPSMYCDVSDAWMLSNRWHRIAISLAGIWVELLIASLAFCVWATSVPGVVHGISFNVMLVCSVGTLLFNANPLVRYDGYYVLMDLAGISNLGQQSSEALSRLFSSWVLGTARVRRLDMPEPARWCLAYAMASIVYRVALTIAVIWGLHLALKPFGMSAFVWVLAAGGATLWGFDLVRAVVQQIRRTLGTGTPRWRVTAGLFVLIVGLLTGLTFPLPRYVLSDAVMEPANRQTFVTAVPGQLKERKEIGETVLAGEVIATFENQDIQRDIRRMEADLQLQREHLQAVHARRNQDPRASEQIPAAESILAAIEHRLAFLLEEQRRLQVRAIDNAVIYPAPPRRENPGQDELSTWTGTLLDSINENAWAEAGDVYCQAGTMDNFEALAVLAQDDLESIATGQTVDILLKSSGKIISGKITKISSLELDAKNDANLGAALLQPAEQQARGQVRGKWYQVQIRCESLPPEGMIVRTRGRVRIHVGTRTFGQWMAVQFFKTFRWHA